MSRASRPAPWVAASNNASLIVVRKERSKALDEVGVDVGIGWRGWGQLGAESRRSTNNCRAALEALVPGTHRVPGLEMPRRFLSPRKRRDAL